MKHPVDVHVGQRVRQRRSLLGMTMQQLGDSVGIRCVVQAAGNDHAAAWRQCWRQMCRSCVGKFGEGEAVFIDLVVEALRGGAFIICFGRHTRNQNSGAERRSTTGANRIAGTGI